MSLHNSGVCGGVADKGGLGGGDGGCVKDGGGYGSGDVGAGGGTGIGLSAGGLKLCGLASACIVGD